MDIVLEGPSGRQFEEGVYPAARDPLHVWALANRRRISVAGSALWPARSAGRRPSWEEQTTGAPSMGPRQ